MSKLEEREARRKQSIVGNMIGAEAAVDTPAAAEQPKRVAKKKADVPESKSKDRVQRAYWLDKDIDKALRRKSLEEEVNLTETVNNALRRGLSDYL